MRLLSIKKKVAFHVFSQPSGVVREAVVFASWFFSVVFLVEAVVEVVFPTFYLSALPPWPLSADMILLPV